MLKRKGYLRQMHHKLAVWRKSFEARRAAATQPGTTMGAEAREQLEASKVAGDSAFAKFAELRRAARRYLTLRDEMDVVWRSIDENPAGAPDEPTLRGDPPARRKRATVVP
jgi:hypothetical protein